MQKINIFRLSIGLLLALAGIWAAFEFSGRNMHVLTPGEQLLEKMLGVKKTVDTALNLSSASEALKLPPNASQHDEDGTTISVSRDGVIEGSSGNIKLRFTPKRQEKLIQWTCSGTPVDSVPSSCKTPLQ